ncbi:response regulator [Pedobacter sp. SYSU D00535]|uniref:response regulator n=1 Tax=Pedobacter sp. SYSU D00535 TaxID=2810308 RepID=UPI001A975D6C|nr:response regulator [Pedobacter sp. SYSU D00535]
MISVLLNNVTGSFKQIFKSRSEKQVTSGSVGKGYKEEGFNLKSASFLIVDDDAFAKFVFAKYVERWNGKVEIANSGAEAIERLKSKKYDVVLMDIEMPGMDGIEATKQIRQLEGIYYQKVPVLAVTSLSPEVMKAKLAAAGMDDCISKEIPPAELYTRLTYFLSRSKNIY